MAGSLLWLAVMLLLCGLLAAGVLVAGMVRTLLRPARMTSGKAMYLLGRLAPDDLGLTYEEMTFSVPDAADAGAAGKLTVAAWWMPHPHAAGKCVVLVHGYADAKIGGIAWAPLFHSLGYHCFALDLRAHGQSGGRHCTAGYFERHDLNAVIDELRAARPADTRHLVLFGVSLGAAVALAAAELRDDIAAVVCECPYADFRRAAMTHSRLLGVPGGALARLTLWLAERLSGARYDAVRPVDLVRRVRCPVMVIRGEDDFLVDPPDAAELEAAVRRRDPSLGHSEYWAIPAAGHVLGLEVNPAEYRTRIDSFLRHAPGDPAVSVPSAGTVVGR